MFSPYGQIAGRVSDTPIAGAGAYVDSDVGGCGATGDGDPMMRLLPCLRAVENMRAGLNPTAACQASVAFIRQSYPTFQGGLICVNKNGEYGGACNGWHPDNTFTYSVRTVGMTDVQVVKVYCT